MTMEEDAKEALNKMEDRQSEHEKESRDQYEKFMQLRVDLIGQISEVKGRVESLHDKLNASTDQSKRVESRLDDLAGLISKITELEKTDSRLTKEVFVANETANNAYQLSKQIDTRVKNIEAAEKERRGDFRKIIITVIISILITLIVGLPNFIAALSKANII